MRQQCALSAKRILVLISWVRLSIELSYRELINRYKWSTAGLLWPLISFGIYASAVSLVYSKVFSMQLNGYLAYLTSGLLAWVFVQSFLVEGVNLLYSFKGLIVNIKLPFLVYNLSLAFKSLILFLLQLPVVLLISLLSDGAGNLYMIFLLPLTLSLVTYVGIRISQIFSICGAISRDFAHLVPSIATLLTLTTPILFPITLLSKATWIYEFNPFYYLITVIRDPIQGKMPQVNHLAVCVLMALVSTLIARFLNKRVLGKVVPIL
jgi:ABC-type polysaccharide/polyol phosphate export permease